MLRSARETGSDVAMRSLAAEYRDWFSRKFTVALMAALPASKQFQSSTQADTPVKLRKVNLRHKFDGNFLLFRPEYKNPEMLPAAQYRNNLR